MSPNDHQFTCDIIHVDDMRKELRLAQQEVDALSARYNGRVLKVRVPNDGTLKKCYDMFLTDVASTPDFKTPASMMMREYVDEDGCRYGYFKASKSLIEAAQSSGIIVGKNAADILMEKVDMAENMAETGWQTDGWRR